MAALRLITANRNYSSWSARAWLALRLADLDFVEEEVPLFVAPDWQAQVRRVSPTGRVPVLIDGELVIFESLAIIEYVAELAPQAGLWPADRRARARARAVSAEMATSFLSLREHLSTNTRARAVDFHPNDATRREIHRVSAIWSECRRDFAAEGDFLFGPFSAADCMYAPVVTRFQTYGIPLEDAARGYYENMLAHPLMIEWLEYAKTTGPIPKYDALLDT